LLSPLDQPAEYPILKPPKPLRRNTTKTSNSTNRLSALTPWLQQLAAASAAKVPVQQAESPTSFVAVALSASRTADDPEAPYALRDSFLLNSRATKHVSNDHFHFRVFKQCSTHECFLAGTEKGPIQGVRMVELSVEGPNGFFTIVLQDVAFVPSFHANMASLKVFMAKGVHWCTDKGVLTFREKTFCKLQSQLGQSLLEFTSLHSFAQFLPEYSRSFIAMDDTEPLICPFAMTEAMSGPVQPMQNSVTPLKQAQTLLLLPNNNTYHAVTSDAFPALGASPGSASDALKRFFAASSNAKNAKPLSGAVLTRVEAAL
jgi:hypothetical protein